MGDHLEYWPREVGFTAQPKLGKVDLDSWLKVQQMKGNFPNVNQDLKKRAKRTFVEEKNMGILDSLASKCDCIFHHYFSAR